MGPPIRENNEIGSQTPWPILPTIVLFFLIQPGRAIAIAAVVWVVYQISSWI